MLFTLKRLLLLAVIAAIAYYFWPRTPSLAGFDEQRISEIQIAIWKGAASKKHLSQLPLLYELYNQQYSIAPVASMKMALDMARALTIFFSAPDASEQENALVPLRSFYVNLKNSTKATFDPNALALMEFSTWMLQVNYSNRAKLAASISKRPTARVSLSPKSSEVCELTALISEHLAVLYGLSAEAWLPAAKKFAQARKDAADRRWDEAKASSLGGWQEVKKLAPAPPK